MDNVWLSGFVLIVLVAFSLGVPLSKDNLPHNNQIDENYGLHWNFNSTHIMFLIRVNTTGYIGLGISEHGKMYPSDVIIAWVKDGDVHFADRHATGHFLPPLDDSQDWFLVDGKEEDGYTMITVVRLLNTCDDQDKPITIDTTKLIYSYSPVDPDSDDSIPYHFESRGTKSVILLDDSVHKTHNLPDDVFTIDILNNNYSVPSADTTYSCTIWKLPPLEGKHHLIKYDPVVQRGHERLVHHIIIYSCLQPVSDELVGKHHYCYYKQPPAYQQCQTLFLAWAIGGTSFDFPPHVGYSLGSVNDPAYFRVEIHYDNSGMRDDFIDNSGIRLYLTKQLREHDAGLLEIGVDVSHDQLIPPYADNFLTSGFCQPDCLAKGIGNETDMHVFATLPHAHLAGKAIVTRIIRNDTELPPIGQDLHYDFDFQETRTLSEERTIKKGDTVWADCYYDTSNRTTVTNGGLSSSEEMCLSFIFYYPRKDLSTCRSRITYNAWEVEEQNHIFNMIQNFDFSDQDVRDNFQKKVNELDFYAFCFVNKELTFYYSERPKNLNPYTPEDKCKQ